MLCLAHAWTACIYDVGTWPNSLHVSSCLHFVQQDILRPWYSAAMMADGLPDAAGMSEFFMQQYKCSTCGTEATQGAAEMAKAGLIAPSHGSRQQTYVHSSANRMLRAAHRHLPGSATGGVASLLQDLGEGSSVSVHGQAACSCPPLNGRATRPSH